MASTCSSREALTESPQDLERQERPRSALWLFTNLLLLLLAKLLSTSTIVPQPLRPLCNKDLFKNLRNGFFFLPTLAHLRKHRQHQPSAHLEQLVCRGLAISARSRQLRDLTMKALLTTTSWTAWMTAYTPFTSLFLCTKNPDMVTRLTPSYPHMTG